jgi:hypothetical protein
MDNARGGVNGEWLKYRRCEVHQMGGVKGMAQFAELSLVVGKYKELHCPSQGFEATRETAGLAAEAG